MKSAIFKPHFTAAAKLLAAAALMLLALASARAQNAQTQDGRLRLESLDRFARKASKTLRVDVDGVLLKFGGSVLDNDDPEEKTIKEIIEGLRGVYVRSYQFASDGEFKDADLDELRGQLRGPGWSRLVDVRTRDVDFDGAEVYALTVGGRVEGMAIFVVQPKRLLVVNVVGAIDLDKLRSLEGSLGIPRIHINRGEKGGRKK
jgi:hypothetical protein